MPVPIPATSPSFPRRLLRDEAYDRLCEAIVLGEFVPGEKLNDQALADWLGTSRTPVREALGRLEQIGLVQTVPGRATVVSEVDPQTTDHAVRVAAVLHSLAVDEAALSITDQDVAAMRAANRRLEAALGGEDVGASIAADDAFHRVAVERAGNPVLTNALGQVMPLLRRAEHLRFGSLFTPDSVQQHDAIVRALAAHDAHAAAAASMTNWLTLQS